MNYHFKFVQFIPLVTFRWLICFFCVAAIGADSEAAESIDVKQLEEDFWIIDAEYEELSQIGEELADNSDDAQAIEDASDRILAKCASDTRRPIISPFGSAICGKNGCPIPVDSLRIAGFGRGSR